MGKNDVHGDKNSPKKQRIEIKDRFVLEALRSTGYDVYSAIYELIDNSIDANSTKIELNYDSQTGVMTISDNGYGMFYDRLIESMNIGCERVYTTKDIGYFGAGLNTSILNLIEFDNDDAYAEITTSNGIKTSVLKWFPNTAPLDYLTIESEIPRNEQGTTILIVGVKKFSPQILKKNSGVMFFPTLKNKVVTLFVNDSLVEPNDPLYRDSELTQTNYVTSVVKEFPIELNCVLIDRAQEKHSWDRETKRGRGTWEASRGGVYAIYGSRYIEFGGNYATGYWNPWDSRTRIELKIPKELTHEFKVKFNKTKGVNFTRTNEDISDITIKIRDMFNWARRLREKMNEPISSEEERDELAQTQKLLNKAATSSDIRNPVTKDGKITKEGKPRGPYNPRNGETPINVPPKNNTPKNGRGTIIIENEIFTLRSENLGISHHLWFLGYEMDKFVIILNEAHVFFRELYRNWPLSVRQDIMFLLGSMAIAQYETCRNDPNFNFEQFWENYWSISSLNLQHLLSNR